MAKSSPNAALHFQSSIADLSGAMGSTMRDALSKADLSESGSMYNGYTDR